MIDGYYRGKVIDIGCRSGSNAMRGNEVTCSIVPHGAKYTDLSPSLGET